jgi:hypothetical protein
VAHLRASRAGGAASKRVCSVKNFKLTVLVRKLLRASSRIADVKAMSDQQSNEESNRFVVTDYRNNDRSDLYWHVRFFCCASALGLATSRRKDTINETREFNTGESNG